VATAARSRAADASRITARRHRRSAMDKLGAALRRIAQFFGGQRVDASAASGFRFDYRHSLACACELAGSHQARSTAADHREMR
jgi:hypothetical protein